MKPRLVLDGEPQEGRRMIPATTAARVRRMLEGVLGPTGTAPEAAVAGYDIAGKTGTAEKPEDGELLQGQGRRLVRRLRSRAATRSCWSP